MEKKSRPVNLRPFHRILGVVVLLLFIYVATTGSLMQMVDLRAILSHAPGTDTEMIQIREGLDGPRNFVVIQPTDYVADALPAGFDYNSGLQAVIAGARKSLGESAPLSYLDLRMFNGHPIGVVRSGKTTARFDAVTGARVPAPPPAPPEPKSLHLTFKVLHVARGAGFFFTVLDVLVALSLLAMTVTGLILYFQLLRTRRRAGLTGMFWSAGGPWRALHRGVSVVAAAFLLVISISGTMLTLDALGTGIYRLSHKDAGPYSQFPPGAIDDFSSPLPDSKLPGMLQTGMSAEGKAAGGQPVKAVRLRYFNGIPKAVVIAGSGNDTQQLVYHGETGAPMSITEPGYPATHYHLGWHEHEIMKEIHRGSFFGVTGRVMDLLSGLSLIFLSISGGVMYFKLWSARRRGGRTAPFWT